MANITISELRPAGSELFQDSESFLNELGEREMGSVIGGITVQVNKQITKNNFNIQNEQVTKNNFQVGG